MTGHHGVTARVLTTSAILAVVFGLVSTPIWGSVGTAVAFSAAMMLSNAWLTILVVRRLGIYPSLSRGALNVLGGVSGRIGV